MCSRGHELMAFPDPGGTRRAWQQKRALSAPESRGQTLSDHVLTQPRKRAGPLDAERQAERDMYYRAIRRPKWQSKAGQAIWARPATRKSDDLVQMAIHDMQRQHDRRLDRSLKDDMDYAAKHYARQITKEVKRQDVYQSEREREFKLAKAKERARVKAEEDKDKNHNWLDLF
eukprot:Tamp_19084.p1 GENE.Tamp_19084~~Tamp_19084.p1  ORF type:complete len:173 (-),score=38.59 Tamp_19084:500-1018(-)